MIIKINNQVLMIVVPQKCGISTVVNILGWNLFNRKATKGEIRLRWSSTKAMLHIGAPGEVEWCKENKIKPELIIGVVRDPIERIKSIYFDRVLTKNKDQLKNLTFEYFFNNFNSLIKNNSDVGRHARKQCSWLSDDVNFYDQIITTNQINDILRPIIEKKIGFEIPSLIKNQSVKSNLIVSEEQSNFFQNYYSEDYEFILKSAKIFNLTF